MNNEKLTIEEQAGRYVALNGRFMREGVYSVRYPQYASSGFILKPSVEELVDEVATRMKKVAATGARP